MFRRIIASGTLAAGLMLTASACDQGLTEVNDNPNAPTSVDAQYLLPEALNSGVGRALGAGEMLTHTALWAQHIVEIQYPSEELGEVRAARLQGYWDGYYAGPLADVQEVVNKGADLGDGNIQGVGLIWRAWLFHNVTDLYGDAPFSEAIQAEEITQPAYDSQQQIYAGMISDLTDGAAMVGTGIRDFAAGDLLFHNDWQQWKRFAASMRMRLAMRMSEVDEAAARSAFIAAYNAGPISDNSENAFFDWPGAPYGNPLFANWQGRDDHGVSATMIDSLASWNDPRLKLYAEPATEDGVYRGLGNNIEVPPQSIAFYSRIGNFWRADGENTPSALFSYAEVLFLAAEAAQRGWIQEDPAALYMAGIRASLAEYQGMAANAPTDAEIEAYLAQPRVQYNAATGMEQIQFQKWLALYLAGHEAWSNWRRIDMPELIPGPDLSIARVPIRFAYPDGEQSLNNDNLQAAITRQGGGLSLTDPVWWDVR